MGTETVNGVARPVIPVDPSKRADGDRAEIKRLAQEFEAMLMTQMLREMRRSMLDDEEEKENGFGAGAMTDTADVELGRALSRVGGVGLTDALLKAFERQIAGASGAGTTGDAGTADKAAAAVSAGSVGEMKAASRPVTPEPIERQEASAILLGDVTAGAPVSSKFGWRQDPLTGATQFHQGIDIAVAYGRDVKAAAEGTVTFAGVQNGYGNTVVIDHERGRQTRYAHLSQHLVRVGEMVAEGQVLGKSGNSGRSTGPHLHFEMLLNGRPVDPKSVAE